MEDSEVMDILKEAILLERRGQAFYSQVAAMAEGQAVKDFFNRMAAEEGRHITELSRQYTAYLENKAFQPHEDVHEEVAAGVMTSELKKQIAAAGFEAAAISAAMTMEKNAIQLYSERARASTDSNEKALYTWLADWEKEHLDVLARLDREVTEEIWHDRQFWPF